METTRAWHHNHNTEKLQNPEWILTKVTFFPKATGEWDWTETTDTGLKSQLKATPEGRLLYHTSCYLKGQSGVRRDWTHTYGKLLWPVKCEVRPLEIRTNICIMVWFLNRNPSLVVKSSLPHSEADANNCKSIHSSGWWLINFNDQSKELLDLKICKMAIMIMYNL